MSTKRTKAKISKLEALVKQVNAVISDLANDEKEPVHILGSYAKMYNARFDYPVMKIDCYVWEGPSDKDDFDKKG